MALPQWDNLIPVLQTLLHYSHHSLSWLFSQGLKMYPSGCHALAIPPHTLSVPGPSKSLLRVLGLRFSQDQSRPPTKTGKVLEETGLERQEEPGARSWTCHKLPPWTP